MLLTVIGDVHGNLVALEKLIEIEKAKTDVFVCHGDLVNYGPWSTECVQLMLSLDNCILLRGNHEGYFLDEKITTKNMMVERFFDVCFERFDKSLLADLAQFELTHELQNYTVQHTINDQYIFLDTDVSKLKIDKNYIIGHSHQQFKRVVGANLIYNTGSVGQNRALIDVACYTQLDTVSGEICQKQFTHDIEAVLTEMKQLNYPDICYDYYAQKPRSS